MGHTHQASATTFPHVSLFTKGDDSVKMVPVRCCLTDVFWAVSFHCRQQFDRISLGANISLEAGFGRIVFLSAVFIVFHSRYQRTLIPLPHSIRPS